MTAPLDDPMFSRRAQTNGIGKCDSEIKTLVPESLRDDFIAIARINGQTTSEMLRDLILFHVHGHLHTLRLRVRGLNETAGSGQE